ncbi:hypothetical protein EJB05_14778, partial [Eragrostis curvula]
EDPSLRHPGQRPFQAGAAGAVIGTYEPDIPFSMPLTALTVTQDHFAKILAYVKRTRSTKFDAGAPPIISSFSSLGPNIITPAILKPPGIDILAAWTRLLPVSKNIKDNRFMSYNILSGTSMACPHATGVAAYVKSFHPDWSPAMIMSALITTGSLSDQLSSSSH